MRSASANPEVAAAWAAGMQRRHMGMQLTVRDWRRRPPAPRPYRQVAADIVAALSTEDLTDALIDHRGWSFDRFEEWLGDSLLSLLLA